MSIVLPISDLLDYSRDKDCNGMWFEGVLIAIHDENTFEVSELMMIVHAQRRQQLHRRVVTMDTMSGFFSVLSLIVNSD